jgi:hypothetical protein
MSPANNLWPQCGLRCEKHSENGFVSQKIQKSEVKRSAVKVERTFKAKQTRCAVQATGWQQRDDNGDIAQAADRHRRRKRYLKVGVMLKNKRDYKAKTSTKAQKQKRR